MASTYIIHGRLPKFSDALLGKFIHHIPCNIMDMSPEALDEYGIWISDYEQVYGHLPEDLAEELKNNPNTRFS